MTRSLLKPLLLLICLMMLAAPLAGLGEPNDNHSPVGELPIVKEPIEMSLFSTSAPHVIDWATNDFTRYMEDQTNIKWHFVQATGDAVQEKINLLMSSGEYPEAIMASIDVAKYGVKEGMLLPLEDLIPKYMPNYWSVMEKNPAYWAQLRQTDGHIYGLAGINVCYHCRYFNKMWVNMNYIEEIGLGVPATTDEFMAVCRRFLELYPKGIAVTGSISGWGEQFIDFLSGSFITNPGMRPVNDKLLVSPEGKVVTQATQKEYREFLKWMKELYAIGAIYDGGFTQQPDQFRSLVNQPDAPCLFIASGATVNTIDPDVNPDLYRAFRVVAPFKGPDGTQICTQFKYRDLIEERFVITDKCKDPIAALRWADQFYTLEGHLRCTFGPNLEGEDYILNPEGKLGLNGEPALYAILSAYSKEPQNHDWQDLGLTFSPEYIRFGQATDTDVDIGSAAGLEKLLLEETKNKCAPYAQDPATQYDILPNHMKITAEEADIVQTIAVELQSYIATNQLAFINGTQDANNDQAWESYLEGFERIGLDKYLEVYQLAWDRMNK